MASPLVSSYFNSTSTSMAAKRSDTRELIDRFTADTSVTVRTISTNLSTTELQFTRLRHQAQKQNKSRNDCGKR